MGANPVLWHKLENGIAPSEIGPNPVWTGSGPNFLPAKFGNGVDCPLSGSTSAIFTGTPLASKQFSFGYYLVPYFGSIYTGGFEYRMDVNESGGDCQGGYYNGGLYMELYKPSEGVYVSGQWNIITPWLAGDKIHIGWTADPTDSQVIRVSVNGIEQPQFIETHYMAPWTSPISAFNIALSHPIGSDGANSIIDNFKLYNYKKVGSDWNWDINNEGLENAAPPSIVRLKKHIIN